MIQLTGDCCVVPQRCFKTTHGWQTAQKTDEDTNMNRLSITFSCFKMEKIQMRDLKSIFISGLHERHADMIEPFCFVWMTTPKIQNLLCNRMNTFCRFTQADHLASKPKDGTCLVCNLFPDSFKVPMVDGINHVCTANPLVMYHVGPVSRAHFGTIAQPGLTHHPVIDLNAQDIVDGLENDLRTAVKKTFPWMDPGVFDQAIINAKTYAKWVLTTPAKADRRRQDRGEVLAQRQAHALTKQHFVDMKKELCDVLECLGIDKSNSSIMWCCVWAAREEVRVHLQSSGQFEVYPLQYNEATCQIDYAVRQIMGEMTGWIEEFCIFPHFAKLVLGYGFISVKMHKAWQRRFITAMPVSPFNPLSELAVVVLNALIDRFKETVSHLEAKASLIHGCEIRLLFDVKNLGDITMNLDNCRPECISKWDVKGNFPSLPIECDRGLLDMIKEFCEYVLDIPLWICNDRKKVQWKEPKDDKIGRFTKGDVTFIYNICHLMITKAISATGDYTVFKTVGIPEGFGASPFFNWIFLTMHPFYQMKKWLVEGRIDIIKSLRYTFRSADDIINFGCKDFTILSKSLWPIAEPTTENPQWLKLISLDNETMSLFPGLDIGSKAHYLNATFWIEGTNTLRLCPYNKLIELNISFFPHEHIVSNMPQDMIYNQLHATLYNLVFACDCQLTFQTSVRKVFWGIHRNQKLSLSRMQEKLSHFINQANLRWKLHFQVLHFRLNYSNQWNIAQEAIVIE